MQTNTALPTDTCGVCHGDLSLATQVIRLGDMGYICMNCLQQLAQTVLPLSIPDTHAQEPLAPTRAKLIAFPARR